MPERRLTASVPTDKIEMDNYPLSSAGVDCFDLITVTLDGGEAIWLNFMCFKLRAVHLEVNHDLPTDSFIMALMRFLELAVVEQIARHSAASNGSLIHELDNLSVETYYQHDWNEPKFRHSPPLATAANLIPVLQLDRYATPIKHHTHSPVQIIDQHSIPGIYATNVPPDNTPNNGSLSIHGKSSGPSELMDSSLTPPEYRSRQFSAAESPTPCSSSASLSTSITSKHNLSPPNTILGTSTNVSGPILQHEIPDVSVYAHSSNSLSCKSSEIPSTYTYGPSLNSSSLIHSTDVCYNEVGDNQACVCEVCHVVYANRSSLRSHMKKHLNQSIKRHQCDQCPYSTQYGKNLFKHIESMHTVDSCQEFRCEGCTRSFTNEDLLRDHDCIVTQYNTYRCSECGRVFKTKLRLKYHADVHNPRKPYVCDIDGCDRAFRTPKYLKNHRDEFHRMHPKNYACPVGQCDLIFHRKTHLKRHIATHDGKSFY
ncbi:unnamed protein product [Trichobilharzia regenti]|nr:unnamed protein product [Trichobilharzia regenti]